AGSFPPTATPRDASTSAKLPARAAPPSSRGERTANRAGWAAITSGGITSRSTAIVRSVRHSPRVAQRGDLVERLSRCRLLTLALLAQGPLLEALQHALVDAPVDQFRPRGRLLYQNLRALPAPCAGLGPQACVVGLSGGERGQVERPACSTLLQVRAHRGPCALDLLQGRLDLQALLDAERQLLLSSLGQSPPVLQHALQPEPLPLCTTGCHSDPLRAVSRVERHSSSTDASRLSVSSMRAGSSGAWRRNSRMRGMWAMA